MKKVFPSKQGDNYGQEMVSAGAVHWPSVEDSQLHPYGKGFAGYTRRPFSYFWASFTPPLLLLAKISDMGRVETINSGTIQGVIQVKVKVYGRKIRNKWGMVNQGNILLLKRLQIF